MADAWGIDDGYHDVHGQWHDTSDRTRRALRVAQGGLADLADPPPRARPVWFVRHGSGPPIQRPAELDLEDGTVLHARDALPPDLPLGYHDLHPDDGGPTTRLIVVPDRCHLPEELRTWAWTVQLYSARSRHSWGIGDLGDLRRLATWSRELGAGFIGVNPMHAALPLERQEPSPYFPSSRRYRNPLYLRLEDVPGWDPADPELAAAAEAGRSLNDTRIIDRDRVHAVKLRALERLWADFGGDSRFDAYVAEQGHSLQQYATFNVLAEHHGIGWRSWPSEHRRPDSLAVERFMADRALRARFHAWLQWLLDEQLARAGAELAVLGDLAVGVDPDGADGWVWQDVFAPGVRVGAPPDEFNPDGQDWGLPPFVPWKLRALGYAPWALTVRAALRHCGALRIDHVMGLFRLYWLPDGAGPTEGGYVRYPGTELLDIVALESARAGAVIVGEDLGTVEDEVREELARRGVLSYRVAWFEERPPARYPKQSLASVTTHDLPTIAGVWSGTDGPAMRDRLVALAGTDDPATPLREVVRRTHARLAEAPSVIVSATLDDALAVEERPNVPGTTTERPNWSLALPQPIEAIEADLDVAAIAALLERD
ncbi:MAG: 4-alpha-glucanotransferase [Acidimicrobiaceae bacterium]